MNSSFESSNTDPVNQAPLSELDGEPLSAGGSTRSLSSSLKQRHHPTNNPGMGRFARHHNGTNTSNSNAGGTISSRPHRPQQNPHPHTQSHSHHTQTSAEGHSPLVSLDYDPKLTAIGYGNVVKQAILDRFRPDLSFPAKFEAMIQYEEIWEEELLSPISFTPLSRDEVTAVNSGNFASNAASGHSSSGTGPRRGGAPIPSRRGRGRGAITAGGVRGGGHGSFTSGSLDRSTMKSSHTSTGDEYPEGESGSLPRNLHHSLDDGGHDNEGEEEILWSIPMADSTLGTFDDQGNFTMTSSPSNRRDEFTTMEGSELAKIPGHDRLPPPHLSHQHHYQPHTVEKKEEIETMMITRWLYRDPSGQIQGPFNTEKMMNWYNRNYFPENLPLRRDQDVIFEPLSAWKLKYGGKNPFEVELEKQKAINKPSMTPTSSGNSSISSSIDEKPISSPPTTTTATTSNESHTGAIFAKLGIPWIGSLVSNTGTSPKPIESTKGGNNVATTNAGPTIAPASSSAAKGPTKIQPLAEEELSFLQKLGNKQSKASSSAESMAISSSPKEKAPLPLVEPLSKLRINNSNSQSTSTTSPSSITHQHPPSPKSLIAPLEVKPVVSPTVGWAKPTQSIAPKSLDEIIKEEEKAAAVAEEERIRKTLLIGAGAPRSFAETLRKADISGGSPPVIAPKSITTPTMTSTSPTIAASLKPPFVTKTINNQSALARKNDANKAATSPTESLRSWCLAQLKPLEASYDIQMCTILLMEFRSPVEVRGFVEDNLKSNHNVNLKTFTEEFIRRRFDGSSNNNGAGSDGQNKASKPVTMSTSQDNVDHVGKGSEEAEFVTVGKKSHRKK